MIDNFDHILGENEKIIKAFKPNKFKLYFSNYLFLFILLLVGIFFIVLLSVMEDPDIPVPEIYISLIAGGWLLIGIIDLIGLKLYYNKRIYAYTNKRMIIRNGIIGVDYKSLDIDMIGAIDVSVNVLDKILNKNTGNIKFGSMARPINPTNTTEVFAFTSIENPYDTYKEIKKYIDEIKQAK